MPRVTLSNIYGIVLVSYNPTLARRLIIGQWKDPKDDTNSYVALGIETIVDIILFRTISLEIPSLYPAIVHLRSLQSAFITVLDGEEFE